MLSIFALRYQLVSSLKVGSLRNSSIEKHARLTLSLSLPPQPIILYFQLQTGKSGIEALDVYDRLCMHESDTPQPLRLRTQSIPSLQQHAQHKEVRRISSALPQATRRPAVHSNEWLIHTQELMRSLRLNRQRKVQLTRKTSRLESHHSSSSEEWYAELRKVPESVNGEAQPVSETCLAEQPPEPEPVGAPPLNLEQVVRKGVSDAVLGDSLIVDKPPIAAAKQELATLDVEVEIIDPKDRARLQEMLVDESPLPRTAIATPTRTCPNCTIL